MTKPKRATLTVILFLGVFLCGTLVVNAQEEKKDNLEFKLEDVTVTATKREEDVQKVPISMEVITADELKISGANDLDEILTNVANVLVNKGSDGLRVTVRGFSDDGSPFHGQSVSMPTVAVNMDGVYSNRKDTGSGLFDLDRIEVLFGPQSTLYSSNSPGGIVNVETANPKLGRYEGSGTIEYGNYNLLHTEGMLNVPVSDIMALRAAFSTQVRDGYMSNGGDDENSKSGRVKALLQPNENFSFLVAGEITKRSERGFGAVDAFADQDEVDDPWHSTRALGAPGNNTSRQIYGRMDWDTGLGSLAVIPSYTTRSGNSERIMEFGDDVTINKLDQDARERSVEVRMTSSPDFFFKWIVGFNYYKSSDVSHSVGYDESGNPKISETPTGEAMAEYRDVDTSEKAKAIYANITYPLTDTFRAVAGYRYSWDDVILYNAETRGIMGGPDAGKLEEVFETHEDNYADPDYRLGVQYDLSENSMLYADYSTSYRVQAMGGGAPGTSAEKPPEKLKSYSVGAKNRFFDNRLQVNASAFYYDYKNFSAGDMVMGYYGGITPDTFDPGATQPDPNSSGFGDGEWIGVDIQTITLISPNDVLDLSISYLKSEWTDLTFDYYYDYMVVGAPPGAPISLENIVPAETVSYNGKSMTKSPDFTVSATYSHTFNLANGGFFDARFTGRYKTDYELSWRSNDYPNNYQEACITGDVIVSYNSADGNWSFSAYVKNIDNYAEKRQYFGEPMNEMMIGNPRTYGAVLTSRF